MRILALLIVAALVSLSAPAEAKKKGPDDVISEIRDDRIIESSGLAVSSKHDDLVYTINDSGTHPMVYAVRLSSGDVVGVTDLKDLDVEDTESIAVDARGILWLGDLGDNDEKRDDVSIIAFPEPGPGTHHLTTADRYGVRFPDGPVDVEGMLVHPTSDQVFLVSKSRDGLGTIYRLPMLRPGSTVEAEDLHVEAPRAVTDATFTHAGTRALLRTNEEVWIYNPTTWEPMSKIETPKLDQGESVTVESGDRTMLLGSEGKNSPILRVPLPDQPAAAPPTLSQPDNVADTDGADDGSAAVGLGVAIPIGLAAIALLIAGVIARRSRRI
ncbi:MAG TPA: hypothetical protein VMZ66_03825 [Aeromicrobium sp.]|nr:hypothetical protein [Aeromicrobium sp.]